MVEAILIVDDEEQIRASVRGVLADEGFRVRAHRLMVFRRRPPYEPRRRSCPTPGV